MIAFSLFRLALNRPVYGEGRWRPRDTHARYACSDFSCRPALPSATDDDGGRRNTTHRSAFRCRESRQSESSLRGASSIGGANNGVGTIVGNVSAHHDNYFINCRRELECRDGSMIQRFPLALIKHTVASDTAENAAVMSRRRLVSPLLPR